MIIKSTKLLLVTLPLVVVGLMASPFLAKAEEQEQWLQAIESDYSTLLGMETPVRKTEIESAAESLEHGKNWDYVPGLKTLRSLRTKAAVPLLIKVLWDRSDSFAMAYDVNNTLTILVGKPLPNKWGLRPEETRQLAKDLAKWWTDNKTSIILDEREMNTDQLVVIVRTLLNENRQNRRFGRLGDSDNAEAINSQISYLRADGFPTGRTVFYPEDLSPPMVPILLEFADKPEYRLATVPLLAALWKNGDRSLEKLAAGSSSPWVNLVYLLSKWAAGEGLPPNPLISMIAPQNPLSLKLTAIVALGQATDDRTIAPVLIKCLADPNEQVRTAACFALRSHQTAAAIPQLAHIVQTSNYYLELLLAIRLLSDIGGVQAGDALVSFLKRADSNQSLRGFDDATQGIEKITGHKWLEGRHRDEDARKIADDVVKWWGVHRGLYAKEASSAKTNHRQTK
jgi:hypothetical protein